MTSTRYVTLNRLGASPKRVPLDAYVKAWRAVIDNPDQWFRDGLDGWGGYGRDIRRQFRQGMHERITARVPYVERGVPRG